MLVVVMILFKLCVGMNGEYKNPPAINYGLLMLGNPCYANWLHDASLLSDKNYLPMVWTLRLPNQPVNNAAIWNEPEEVTQANTPPDVAAKLTLSYTKQLTSFGCCGTLVDDRGLEWLNKYINAGGPIPTYWHIHIYDISYDAWLAKYSLWLQWNRIYGKNRPFIISETSMMYGSISEQLKLMYHLKSLPVDVYWFSIVNEPGLEVWNSSLLDNNFELTQLGNYFIGDVPTALPVVNEPQRKFFTYFFPLIGR